MPTVMQAVGILEKLTNVPPSTIRNIARKLIDDEILPKSQGRRIEKISTREFVFLFISVICTDKLKDAVRVGDRYFSLKIPAGDSNIAKLGAFVPDPYAITAGDWLDVLFRNMLDIAPRVSADAADAWLMFGHVEFSLSRPEVNFYTSDPDGSSILPLFPLRFAKDQPSRDPYAEFRERTVVKVPYAQLAMCAAMWHLIETEGVGNRYPPVTQDL